MALKRNLGDFFIVLRDESRQPSTDVPTGEETKCLFSPGGGYNTTQLICILDFIPPFRKSIND
jgi:hypothetical protein